jgi:hypothetical protein
MKRSSILLLSVGAFLLAASLDASACAVCFGKTDSRLAQGMNMGILVLLAVIGSVLAGVVSFFVYVAKRSAAHAAEDAFSDETPVDFSEDSPTDKD